MHRPHAPTQRKCVPIISHNNHQSDITICKGCPTRKDASPFFLHQLAKRFGVFWVYMNLISVSRKEPMLLYPSHQQRNPSMDMQPAWEACQECQVSSLAECISLMHQPRWKCVPALVTKNPSCEASQRCPARKDALPSRTNLEESLCPSQVAITI